VQSCVIEARKITQKFGELLFPLTYQRSVAAKLLLLLLLLLLL